MKKAVLSMAVIAALLAGCAQERLPYPRAAAGPKIEQLKLQSAAHWDLVARNEAERIVGMLPTMPTVFVTGSPGEGTPFNQALHRMLVSNLVKEGADVMLDPRHALYEVEYDFQTVTHSREEMQRFQPGLASAFLIAYGLLDESVHWGEQELVLIPLTAGIELWNAFWPHTSEQVTEVIVNTRVHNGSRIVSADSRVYYFNARDMHNFREGRRFPVVGATGDAL